jgi:predicted RNA-binding Zn-ribbon protein involved in translation (DUF1610 family)
MKRKKIYCFVCKKNVRPHKEHNGYMFLKICPNCGLVFDSKSDGSVSIDQYMQVNQID